MHHLLIPHVRRYDPDVNSAFGGKRQRGYECVIYYKIRRHYIHVSLCLIDDMSIYVFANVIRVKRTVTIWLNEAVAFFLYGFDRSQIIDVLGMLMLGIGKYPVFQKNRRKRPSGVSFKLNCGILPTSVLLYFVYIFVAYIYTAREGDLAVDRAYFLWSLLFCKPVRIGLNRLKARHSIPISESFSGYFLGS